MANKEVSFKIVADAADAATKVESLKKELKDAKKVLEDLKKFNIQILEKHWYKLDEKNVEHMQRIPHLACLRSNGNPYYMYFTKYDDIPIIYYIDKI